MVRHNTPIPHIDRLLLGLTLLLATFGFVLFVSAALGIFATNNAKFYGMVTNQSIFLVTGVVTMFLFGLYGHYEVIRQYALPFFGFAVLLCFLVFVPGVGFEHGGARRWIDLRFVTLQTGEVLKIAAVVYCAGWYSVFRQKIHEFKYGLLPLLCVLSVSAFALLLQPDTDTYVVLAVACVGVYMAAGGRWKDVGIIGLIGTLGLGVLVAIKPYLWARILTFLGGSQVDVQGAGYQVYQGLIAIGSGGFFGNGIGQSVQKFGYVPEPAGDSIFAILSEETGFIGASVIMILFLLIFLRIVYIAKRAEGTFGGLLAIGIGMILLAQVAFNVCSMIGLIPLSGLPLPLVSHGGTALLLTLLQIGVILNISKTMRTI